MTVYVLQVIDGEPDAEQIVDPPHGTDEETLRVKAESAADKGWDVEWLDARTFVARKVRWEQEAMCERIFRAD